MKKLSENYAIVFEEDGPTGRYETVEVEVIRGVAGTKLDLLKIKTIERKDTISGHIAFFREMLAQLREFRMNGNAEYFFIDNRKMSSEAEE